MKGRRKERKREKGRACGGAGRGLWGTRVFLQRGRVDETQQSPAGGHLTTASLSEAPRLPRPSLHPHPHPHTHTHTDTHGTTHAHTHPHTHTRTHTHTHTHTHTCSVNT